MDGEDVHAVDAFRGNREGAAPVEVVRARGDRAGLCKLTVAVVLADIHHWQLPDCGHVHGLEQHALVEDAVAKKADGDLAGAPHPCRECGTGGERHTAADDCVRAEVATRAVIEMHRAAPPAAKCRPTAHELREELRGI